MEKIIIYYTLTDLPLEVQQDHFNDFHSGRNCRVIKSYIEKIKWKTLAIAIAHANQVKALLIIPKLGRLEGNTKFTRILQESDRFLCLDKPTVNHTTINMVAAVAWETALRTSRLKREAFSRLREAGTLLASADPQHWKGHDRAKYAVKASKAAAKKRQVRTKQAYEFLLPIMLNLYRQNKEKQERSKYNWPVYKNIAKQLNELGHRTVIGTKFNGVTVFRVMKRYGNKKT